MHTVYKTYIWVHMLYMFYLSMFQGKQMGTTSSGRCGSPRLCADPVLVGMQHNISRMWMASWSALWYCSGLDSLISPDYWGFTLLCAIYLKPHPSIITWPLGQRSSLQSEKFHSLALQRNSRIHGTLSWNLSTPLTIPTCLSYSCGLLLNSIPF